MEVRTARRHGPRDPRGPVAVRLVRRATACQAQWKAVWSEMVYEHPDGAYRRLYYYLHKLVDQAIGRIVEALDQAGMANETSWCSPPTTATCSVRTAG